MGGFTIYGSTRFSSAEESEESRMLLLELGDDVLRLIVSNLESWHGQMADAIKFALTCRYAYSIASSVLPRYMSITIPSKRYTLLQRSIRENPSYLRSVYYLTISFGPTLTDDEELRAILDLLPGLKTLEIEYVGSTRLIPVVLSLPEAPFTRSLQALNITDSKLTTSELLSLLYTFPRLQSLSLEYFTDPFDSVMGNEPHRQSSIQSLDLCAIQIGVHLLTNILQRCQKLRTLSCKVPLVAPQRMRHRETTMQLPLSPKNIMPAFLNVANTLNELDLSTQTQRWPGHDGSRMDFSKFLVLKRLTASALCFLSPLSLGVSRDGLYRLLPRRLQYFQLNFCIDIGIFYFSTQSSLDEVGRDRVLTEEIDESEYRWIVELATHMSSLEEVWLYERKHSAHSAFVIEEWDAPLSVEDAFEEAEIDLMVLLRALKLQKRV
ncbi:RNI-like protein [Glarea lozoyensis ATCC 20868]|uniref:RNI-like protein n=1 Tax=Glarea lozoyensis (strain ATCC 20868 / MF5171) TaxID=1116229 RepID=S3DRG0_GLAL2|nr:RNI-like protein [Glarea lozoyensis ATCC 20868]EPE34596.1 RNI-like protein [Glarea lozoyensis ATCC 20868]